MVKKTLQKKVSGSAVQEIGKQPNPSHHGRLAVGSCGVVVCVAAHGLSWCFAAPDTGSASQLFRPADTKCVSGLMLGWVGGVTLGRGMGVHSWGVDTQSHFISFKSFTCLFLMLHCVGLCDLQLRVTCMPTPLWPSLAH